MHICYVLNPNRCYRYNLNIVVHTVLEIVCDCDVFIASRFVSFLLSDGKEAGYHVF